jgi:acetaldehyde dehydrogenase/alcohol dehydrogenase
MDVLTHAIEAYVSVCASDYTDPLALQAIRLVIQYLERACRDGNDREAREKMHNASCIAGLAFTNAFLGINHSLAHILGSRFHIPHGRANAVLMPHVIAYNASTPSKFTSFPNYEKYVADRKYAEIADALGIGGKTVAEGVNNLIERIRELMAAVHMPLTIREMDVQQSAFQQQILDMATIAFDDQCTGANPRYPLVRELEDIYRAAYGI